MHDVIIIGAGFTGLAAALELKRRGNDVVVLEGRDRVGGRVESQVNRLGERIDTGGQFVCDDMVEVMALLRERGHRLVETRFDGKDIAQPPLPAADLESTWRGSMAIRERMNGIEPADPAIAGLSVAAWLDGQPDAPPAKAAFRSMIEGLWCLALDELPLWHLIDNDRRITNEQHELQYFPDGTLHALAEDLARDLGDAVRLSRAASAIRRDAGGVTAVTAGGDIRAHAVIVALPPATAARLRFEPALPAPLARALSVWRSGAVIKLVLRYPTAFWRDKGLSGVVMWRDPTGLFACDTGRPESPTLSAFVGGELALQWRQRGLDWVRDEMLRRLGDALGPEAAMPLDATLRDWSLDPWSGGGYSDLIVDMDATNAEATLVEGYPPVHFASSEL
ncbi:MAG: FAD-dependent oxidoreductase, partial [Mesorhizobium sp.]|nr:FAD-dependent oxidoreductase [Mesorhizobium sp.]